MLGGRLAARLGCCRCLGVVGSAVGAFLATISATIAVPIAMAAFASFVMATATFATMAVRGLAGSSCGGFGGFSGRVCRSEEHTSELQSLMRISYAVFCLKQKKTKNA